MTKPTFTPDGHQQCLNRIRRNKKKRQKISPTGKEIGVVLEFAERNQSTIPCRQCGAKMPNDTYARTFGRCARHADEERTHK